MFWHGSGSDGCRAVSDCFTCHAPGKCLLSFSKQSNTALPVLPDDVMVLQHSPELCHRSTFLQETSTCPANIYHPQPDCSVLAGLCPAVSFHQRKEGVSPARLSLLCEINGQCGMDAVLLADWDSDSSLLCSFRYFSSHIWRCQFCLGFAGQGWCLLKIVLSCLTQVESCPFRSECVKCWLYQQEARTSP